MTKASANLLAVGVGASVGLGLLGVGLSVSIVMAVVASILFLGLLMMKVVLAISTVLVFIGMPIAIVALAGRTVDLPRARASIVPSASTARKPQARGLTRIGAQA